MKSEDLFEALNEIKDEYVAQAGENAPVKRSRWSRWGALAACAALAAAVGMWLGGPGAQPPAPTLFIPVESIPAQTAAPTSTPVRTAPPSVETVPPTEVKGLPVLPVEIADGGMGFEGLMVYSVDELADSRPWRGEVLETLPVYRNKYPADAAGYAEVEQRVRVNFEPRLELPEGLRFTYTSTASELMEVGEYIKTEYAGMLDMEAPVAALGGGDYYYNGEGPHYDLYFYDGAGDLVERMLAYDLRRQWWCCDGEGRLMLVWQSKYDLSEKVGDYPVLTPGEAEEQLRSGGYITSVPVELTGEESVERVELMYRDDWTAEYFMPYYRFLIDVTGSVGDGEARESGLKTYGAYYVPAVRGEYLTGMPTWNGSFN